MMNRPSLLKLTGSLLCFGYLALIVDVPALGSALGDMRFRWYAASTAIFYCSLYLTAWKYHRLFRGTSVERSAGDLVRIHLLSMFYGFAIPAGIGVNAVWWYSVTKNGQGRQYVLVLLLLEMLLNILLLIPIALLPLALRPDSEELGRMLRVLAPMLVVLAMLALLAAVALSSGRLQMLLRAAVPRRLFVRWSGMEWTARPVDLPLKNRAFRILITLGLAGQFAQIARMHALALAVDSDLGFMDMAWISALVMLVRAVPVTAAGIGITELGLAYLFSLIALPAEQGVAVGLLVFSQVLFFTLAGGVLAWSQKD